MPRIHTGQTKIKFISVFIQSKKEKAMYKKIAAVLAILCAVIFAGNLNNTKIYISQAQLETDKTDSKSITEKINYQGYLTDNSSSPITNPALSITFKVYDDELAGTVQWEGTKSVVVENGIFSTTLDIPATVFSGDARWLELTIDAVALTPRTELTAVGYSYKTLDADKLNGLTPSEFVKVGDGAGGDLNGDYPNPSIGDNAVTSAKILNGNVTMPKIAQAGATSGQVLKWDGSAWAPANDTVGGSGAGVYLPLAGGNMTGAITSAGDPSITMGKGNFGTNNINPGTMAYVAGANNKARGQYSVVAGGGGATDADSNSAIGEYSTVGGGKYNVASGYYSTVAGGGFWYHYNGVCTNTASGYSSSIGGGYGNKAEGSYTIISGGIKNRAIGECAVISGGQSNHAEGEGSAIGGGEINWVVGDYATISGGRCDSAVGNRSAIGGGYHNITYGPYNAIGGGYENITDDSCATIGGGQYNKARGRHSVVAGGGGAVESDSNAANGIYSVVSGGRQNISNNNYSTVSGGLTNLASGRYAVVGGGTENTASGYYNATVGGGAGNTASGDRSTVSGGRFNSASGDYATVGGGYADTSAGDYSFTVGNNSVVPGSYSNSAAFNGQTASASSQLRCGALVGTSKSFQIDHPLDPDGKFLNHFSIESPQMLVTYDGEAVIGSDGRVMVSLPAYFSALTKQPRIQLTGVGSSDVYVAEKIIGNTFVIGGRPNTEVYWQVSAERKDVSAEVTKILMPVEQVKTGDLRNVSADDNYLVGTMKQLQDMGHGTEFNFRTQKGQEKYESMLRALQDKE
jgi:hypothetical protein